MLYIRLFFVPLLFFMSGCFFSREASPILSEKYVHKYGFDVSEQEWAERSQDGQHIVVLKNGVRVARSYENGELHGPSTYTYPHSEIIEKLLVYDQGTLLKETSFDSAGVPIREDLYEFDNRNIITLWDEKGSPLSIEEYFDDKLTEGKYYTKEHILEASVEDGCGERFKRDRTGQLISKDTIEQGEVVERTTYHPNEEVHAISHYENYELHGEQLKFTASGKPLLKLHWNRGILDGTKVVYRNGWKVAEIPYVMGKKEGIERHYDDLGNLTAEIEWREDRKHGPSKFYTDETIESEWFFRGKVVDAEKFESLEERELQFSKFSFHR